MVGPTHSSIASKWVRYKIVKARKREVQEERRLLFPIGLLPFEELWAWDCFDADTATDSAAEIRSYYIPDFSDPVTYDAAFERLVVSSAESKAADEKDFDSRAIEVNCECARITITHSQFEDGFGGVALDTKPLGTLASILRWGAPRQHRRDNHRKNVIRHPSRD